MTEVSPATWEMQTPKKKRNGSLRQRRFSLSTRSRLDCAMSQRSCCGEGGGICNTDFLSQQENESLNIIIEEEMTQNRSL